jgi:hypothetical protein
MRVRLQLDQTRETEELSSEVPREQECGQKS